ncbi:MAG: hypothetical protein MOGMAGMI_00914 [Candidatus Omnitrophica bacterium]|nr:hypothetical protein [Candidatus Omnitrophota bacterium]
MSDAKTRDLMDRLEEISRKDGYAPDAYLFVMASLDRAMRRLSAPRHITGAELLEAIRQEAVEAFGPMASTVLRHWGIKNSLDFGSIVFNMVREQILSKSESDRPEDFCAPAFIETLFDSDRAYRLTEEPKAPRMRPASKTQSKQGAPHGRS